MATSRGATPANPTLAATTEDNSRGGLFVRSNVANPVAGADISGIAVNDSTITITLNYADGTSESESFTLNQSNPNPDVLTFTVPGSAGGGSGGPTNAFNAVEFDTTDPDVLIFTRADGTGTQNINLSRFDDGTAIAQAIANANIPRDFTALMDTPDTITTSNTGQYLTANAAGDELVWAPLPGNVLNTADFESSDMTIADSAGTQTGRINLAARPLWTGNTNRGGITGNVNATRIVLDASTNLILRDDGSGVYTITTPGAAPAQGNAGVALTVPQVETAFTTPPPPSGTVNADPGTTITTVTGRITNEDMSVDVSATTRIENMGDTAVITFPASTTDRGAGDYGNDGTYTVTTMTTVTTPETVDNPRTITTMETFNRFVPFYQVRRTTVPTTLAHLQAGTESTAAFDNTTGISTIAGDDANDGNLYFATTVLTNTNINACTNTSLFGFEIIVEHVGTISTTDYGGDPLTYNVFQIFGINTDMQVLNNFRVSNN